MKIGDIVIVVNALEKFNGKEVEIISIDGDTFNVKFIHSGEVRTGQPQFFVSKECYNSPLFNALKEDVANEID